MRVCIKEICSRKFIFQAYNKTQIYKLISCICFIGNQTSVKDDETNGEENKRLLQELKRIGFEELYSIFINNHVKLAEDAWDLDFLDLTSIGVPHIQAKKFVKAVEKDVSGILIK